MAGDWQTRRFGDFAERIRKINDAGLELEPLSVTKGEGVVLQSSRFSKRIATDLRKYQIAQRGEFIFDPMSLYYGAIGRFDVAERGVVSPDYVVFRVDCSVDPEYFLALVRSPRMWRRFESLSEVGNRSGKRRRLYWSGFRDIDVSLPPLPEQRKIAAILSSVEEAIEKSQAVIDQVQVVKKGLMQELLTKGLPGRHKTFKKTEAGRIPAEWKVRRLGDVTAVSSGGTPNRSRAECWKGTIPWVKTGEVNYKAISDTEEHLTPLGVQSSAAKLLPVGTVLMAMYGQGKTRGRVGWLEVEATTNQACAAIEVGDAMNSRFIYHLLSWMYDRIRILGNEGSQKNLNLSLIKQIDIPVPPLDEQIEIGRAMESFDVRASRDAAVLDGYRTLKSALQSLLLTGELRVRPDPTPEPP